MFSDWSSVACKSEASLTTSELLFLLSKEISSLLPCHLHTLKVCCRMLEVRGELMGFGTGNIAIFSELCVMVQRSKDKS